jgi:hypothetical protein
MRTPPGMARVLLQVLELQVPMVLGALVCFVLGRFIGASWDLATVYRPGTYLFTAGDLVFLTLPVMLWMIIRGYDGRSSLEMVAAMIAPVCVIIIAGQLTGAAYRLWLVTGMYPLMSAGMLACIAYWTYRRGAGARKSRPR